MATLKGAQGFVFEYGDVQPLFARSGHVAVRGRAIYLGDADALEVRVYSTSGRRERVMRALLFDLSLSSGEVEEERRRLLSHDMPAPFREAIETLPSPATRPAYSGLLVDPAGHLWAIGTQTGEATGPNAAQVFGPDGQWLGRVEIPEGFRMLEVGLDYVLGVRTDALGIERVQLLSLVRRGK